MSAPQINRARSASLSAPTTGTEQEVTIRVRSASLSAPKIDSVSISDNAKTIFAKAQETDSQKTKYDLNYKHLSNLKNAGINGSVVTGVAAVVSLVFAGLMTNPVTLGILIAVGIALVGISVLSGAAASKKNKEANRVVVDRSQFLVSNMTTEKLLEKEAWVFKYVDLPEDLRPQVEIKKQMLEETRKIKEAEKEKQEKYQNLDDADKKQRLVYFSEGLQVQIDYKTKIKEKIDMLGKMAVKKGCTLWQTITSYFMMAIFLTHKKSAKIFIEIYEMKIAELETSPEERKKKIEGLMFSIADLTAQISELDAILAPKKEVAQ